MVIYLISGLAADDAVFRHLRFPEGWQPVYLSWIPPLQNESLESYAFRMTDRIDRSTPFALLGLSMGGMIVSTLASELKPVQTILISSIPLSKNLPFYFRLLGLTGMHRWMPISFFQRASLLKRFFTTETREDKQILKGMISRADPAFIRWALRAILKWRNKMPPHPQIHIHGTRDALLPVWMTKPTHKLRGAGHLMVLNRASEINEILALELGKIKLQL